MTLYGELNYVPYPSSYSSHVTLESQSSVKPQETQEKV